MKAILLLGAFFITLLGGELIWLGLNGIDRGRMWRGRTLLAVGVALAFSGPLLLLIGWGFAARQ